MRVYGIHVIKWKVVKSVSYLDIIKQAIQANADRKQVLKNFEKTVASLKK